MLGENISFAQRMASSHDVQCLVGRNCVFRLQNCIHLNDRKNFFAKIVSHLLSKDLQGFLFSKNYMDFTTSTLHLDATVLFVHYVKA